MSLQMPPPLAMLIMFLRRSLNPAAYTWPHLRLPNLNLLMRSAIAAAASALTNAAACGQPVAVFVSQFWTTSK